MRITSYLSKPNLISRYLVGNGFTEEVPLNTICQSYILMSKAKLISSSGTGTFNILPIGMRSLDKLSNMIVEEMNAIGGIKVSFSCLSNATLWKKSKRWSGFGEELIKLRLSDSNFCLNPTHEEAITNYVSTLGKLSSNAFPIRLYQITPKFRNEPRPRFGLLRCREFLMKDMYAFDTNKESAMESYEQVCVAYEKIFSKLGLKFIKAKSICGNIGGEMSHEYLVPSNIGEDTVFITEDGTAWNAEFAEQNDSPQVRKISAIEIGHSFYLGTHYSKIFNAMCQYPDQETSLMHMGCYGLGVTRILATCIEALSEGGCIKWPYSIAPFKVCILPPKRGSKESKKFSNIELEIYDELDKSSCLKGDIIIDDRTRKTIGRRMADAKVMGYPVIIVIGKQVLEEQAKVEIIMQNINKTVFIEISEAVKTVIDLFHE